MIKFTDKTYEKNHFVTLENAEHRKSLLNEDLEYTVKMSLPRGDYFFGSFSMKFSLNSIPGSKPLYLDFRGVQITNYKVNAKDVEYAENIFTNHLIEIPSSHLNLGENELSMDFLNKYRKDGVGLHSFIDSVDKEQYTYTQFEADFCHYVFPNFD